MYDRLNLFLEKHKIIYDLQFGFQKNKSAVMALIEAVDIITKALDKGEVTIGISLDLSKAFDTVNHGILIDKLQKYGIRGIAIDWFKNYLENRRQYVIYNGNKSNEESITYGVPQGSILGPLLFLIYINDLSSLSENCQTILFADDANLLFSSRNKEHLVRDINNELNIIQEWMNINELSLNLKKTEYIIYKTTTKKVSNLNIKIGNVPIERVQSVKFLGVKFDELLSWKSHVDHIRQKMARSIGIILKTRKKFNSSTMITMYYSFVYPYINYCNHVWGNTYITNLKPIILLHKKIIRIVTGSPYLSHTEPLMKEFNLLNLISINKLTRTTFMYRCLNNQINVHFGSYFCYNRDVHQRDTRSNDDLYTPSFRLDVRRFSIRVAGPDLWNSIPQNIKESQSLQIFKRQFKEFLLNSQVNPM